MSKESCLLVGGARDGQWWPVETGEARVQINNPSPLTPAMVRVGPLSIDTVAIDATIYKRVRLSTKERRWFVYLSEELDEDEIIPLLLRGYFGSPGVTRS